MLLGIFIVILRELSEDFSKSQKKSQNIFRKNYLNLNVKWFNDPTLKTLASSNKKKQERY